jgi:hypothetical protein
MSFRSRLPCLVESGNIIREGDEMLSGDTPLSAKALSLIRGRSKDRLRLRIGALNKEKADDLLTRQVGSPAVITLVKTEIVLFAAAYIAAVRETTKEFTEELAGVVGRRKGLGKPERKWVLGRIRDFYQSMTSPTAGEAWFHEAFSMFTLTNEEETKKDLLDQVNKLAGSNPPSSSRRAIAALIAMYRGHSHKEEEPRKKPAPIPTGGEKVADPARYPTMTVAEVREVLSMKSRSTIYRYLEEGPLERADMGKKSGKRRSCLIRTSSVRSLLKESSE